MQGLTVRRLSAAVAGAALVVASGACTRGDASPAAGGPAVGDHWHAAIGVYACERFLPNLTDRGEDASGIHAHGDGLVHLHPTAKRFAGDKATLGAFGDSAGLDVTTDQLVVDLPSGKRTYSTKDGCRGKASTIAVVTWDSVDDATGTVATDPAALRLRDGQLVTVAVVPEGAKIPKPDTAAALASPSDVSTSDG